MKTAALAAGLLVLAPAALAEGPTLAPALAETLKRFTEAFNSYDAKAVASFWAEDGTLISPVGEVGIGRDAVANVYQHDVDKIVKGSRSSFQPQLVRKLKGGLVLLDLTHEMQNFQMPDGTVGTMKLHVVILAQEKGGSWHWLDARPYAFLKPPPPPAR